MQIPKIPVMIGAFLLGATLISTADDNAAQAAARAALNAKLAELNAMPETKTAMPAPEPSANQQMTRMNQHSMANTNSTATMNHSSEMEMHKQAVLSAEKRMAEESIRNQTNVMNANGFKPIIAPALPISAPKAQRLEELLQKYKADQITPQQYQNQREAILKGS